MKEISKELNSGVEDEYDNNDIDDSKPKLGVGIYAGVKTSHSGVGIVLTIEEEVEENKIEIPRELDSYFEDAPY